MSALLVAAGLVLLGTARRAPSGVLALGLWCVGTPLLDLAVHGPWPAALAFTLAALALRAPAPGPAARMGLALAAGVALAALGDRTTWSADVGPVGAFAIPDGLLARSPLAWVALAGSALGARTDAARFGAAVVTLAVTCADVSGPLATPLLGTALALLGPGFAAALAALGGRLRDRPARALWAAGVTLVGWNLLSMESYRRTLVPRDDTVAFADLAGTNAAVLRALVGTPLAFPANAWFGWRHDVSLARWDRLAQAFPFEPYPGLGSEIALAGPGPDVDGLLDGGWGARVPCPPMHCRNLAEPALVHFQLRRPTRLALAIEARGPGELDVALDGNLPLGRLALGDTLTLHPLRPAGALAAGLRTLTLRPVDGARLRVARVVFVEERR